MKLYSLILIIILLGMNVFVLDQNIQLRYYNSLTIWAAHNLRADFDAQRVLTKKYKGLYLECIQEFDILENH